MVAVIGGVMRVAETFRGPVKHLLLNYIIISLEKEKKPGRALIETF